MFLKSSQETRKLKFCSRLNESPLKYNFNMISKTKHITLHHTYTLMKITNKQNIMKQQGRSK